MISRKTPSLAFFAALALALVLSVGPTRAQAGATGTVNGTVLTEATNDAPSTPVAGAFVVATRFNQAEDFFGNPSRPVQMTTTDAEGHFSMPDLPVGNLLVTVTAPGYYLVRSERVHLGPGGTVDLTLYLVKGETTAADNPGTLTGQVVRLKKPYGHYENGDHNGDGETSDTEEDSYRSFSRIEDHPTSTAVFEPVPGAFVTTFWFDASKNGVEPPKSWLLVTGDAITDQDGRFVIHPLNPGYHLILAEIVGSRPTTSLADISSTQTTEANILIIRAGDNPTTFPSVVWVKSDRPGDPGDAGWSVESSKQFTPPLPGKRNGWLTLRAQNNRNTFGFWQSKKDWLHRIPNSLYQVHFVVATDQPDPADSPGVRLRANSSSLMQTDIMRISSLGDAGLAPTMQGTPYDLFFEPMDTGAFLPRGLDRINLSFDLLNFDPHDAPDGEVILKSFTIDVHSLNMIQTTTSLGGWDFEDGPQGWQAHESVPPFDSVDAEWTTGSLVLRTFSGGNAFGYWTSPADGFVAPEAGALIRAAFDVRSNQGDPSKVATVRVRLNSADGQESVLKVVPSLEEGLNSPDTKGRTYRIYFQVPPALAGQPLTFAIDVLDFDSHDAADNALYLDNVAVDEIQLPAVQ